MNKLSRQLISPLWEANQDLNFGQVCKLANVAEEAAYQAARKLRREHFRSLGKATAEVQKMKEVAA